MANPSDLIPIDQDFAALMTALAPYFVGKIDRVPRTKEQIDLYHSKWWSDQQDNLMQQILPRVSLQKRYAQEKSVKFDGSHDNALKIQELVDEVASTPGGGTVVLPPGIGYVSSGLVLPSNVALEGQGAGVTTLVSDIAGAVIAPPNTTPSPLPGDRSYYINIRDLAVSNTSKLNAGSIGIDLSQISHADIKNVRVYEAETGIKRRGWAYYSNFYKVDVSSCVYGLDLAQGCNSNNFYGGKIDDCDIGAWIHQVDAGDPTDGTNQWNFFGTHFEGQNDYHIKIEALTDQGIRGISAIGCRFEAYNTAYAIGANAFADQIYLFGNYYANLMPGLNDIQCPSHRWIEVGMEALSHLSVRDVTNLSQVVQILYRSSNDFLHFCRNSNLTSYVTGVFKDLIAAGTNGTNGSLSGGYLNLGRAPSVDASDFALSAGWGATASIHVYPSNDSVGRFYVTANGAGIAANPTITLTFKNPRTNAPVVIVTREGGAQMATSCVTFPANTQVQIVFQGTPVAGESFGFQYQVVGRD